MKFIINIIFLVNICFAQINNYTPIFEPFSNNGKDSVYIRKFMQNGQQNALVVDANTLKTSIVLYRAQQNIDISGSKYFKLLKQYSKPPFILAEYGLKQIHTDGIVITIDMCQSSKEFEKALFERLKNEPVAICMSGKWAQNHKSEFAWLINNMKNVTWVNHSMTHPYYKNLPYEENFLLSQDVNFDYEVLGLEVLLLENNITPSIYFRFPGLISDEKRVKMLNRLGLVPLSTNAWLAKKQNPKKGSIVLIHGNGNEPDGIKAFFSFDKQNKLPYRALN
ncbi:MAG: hypothetical protein RL154_1464 [Pseudomonadota bacterium]|jgi:hypothetical protein